MAEAKKRGRPKKKAEPEQAATITVTDGEPVEDAPVTESPLTQVLDERELLVTVHINVYKNSPAEATFELSNGHESLTGRDVSMCAKALKNAKKAVRQEAARHMRENRKESLEQLRKEFQGDEYRPKHCKYCGKGMRDEEEECPKCHEIYMDVENVYDGAIDFRSRTVGAPRG